MRFWFEGLVGEEGEIAGCGGVGRGLVIDFGFDLVVLF